ncbi:MAG: o-succinylbenzoate--CoA ligase [candidate division Zixibacteria bacterium]|nr:o-succinylbenzoate--CoA ligase [candidate division Zixibacteria bacterium]
MAEILCPLKIAAKEHGNQPALIDRQVALTWSRTESTVDHLADFLTDSGVRCGDRVAIIENNRIELPILILALIRIGAVSVLLSPRYPESTVAMMAAGTGCRHCVFWTKQTREALLPNLKSICLPSLAELSGDRAPDNATDCCTSVDTDQPTTIIFTSGSTASPKAVLLSYGNHYYNALGSNANLPVLPGDRWLLSLPLYHVGGLGILFRCLLGGGTVVLTDSSMKLGEQIARDRITHLSLVPTQLRRLLDDPRERGLSSTLKAILLGGSPIPATLLSDAVSHQLPVYLTYGLTEMASQVATGCSDQPRSPRALPYRELRIAVNGEIVVRGQTLFKGYVEHDSIVYPLDTDGWFHTGDLGSLDNDGRLVVLGRKDNMFVSGGENIQPEQIEQVLMAIDGILDALVVPVDDREYGHRPVAFIRYRSEINLSEPNSEMPESERLHFDHLSLSDELSRALPRFMLPAAYYPWPHGYQPAGIKTDRAFLRELAGKLYRSRK